MTIIPFRFCLFLAAAAGAAFADTPLIIEAGKFSRLNPGDALPADWKPLTFKSIEQHTVYSLVKDDDHTVIKADAKQSASGLTHAMKIDAKEYPILQWRWKVGNLIDKADPHSKAGDDYPARIYITFEQEASKQTFGDKLARKIYGKDIPHSGINYIWDSKTPIATVLPNAYTKRLRMIVVESGPAKLNQWQDEERNVYEDYKRAFGEEPPPISGVAIMTDADNTGESATAWYGDIRFKKLER